MFMPRKKNSGKKPLIMWLKKHLVLTANIFLLFAGFVAVYQFQNFSQPIIGTVEYNFEGGETHYGKNPVFVKPENSKIFLKVPVKLGLIHISQFHLKPDDCIEDFYINDVRVDDSIAQFCDYSEIGPKLDLSPYLSRGENEFRFKIRDDGGLAGIRITPAKTAVPILVSYLLFLGLLIWLCVFVYKRLRFNTDVCMASIFLAGSLLRLIYVLATPFKVRGHDTDAHINYINYVAENFTIPPAAGGFEYHQAPLYYFIVGIWTRLMRIIGFSDGGILQQTQIFSLITSIAVLAIGMWIGCLLFKKKNETTERLLFSAIIAVFPALIFLSGRITNNGLHNLFVFLTIALLIKWWTAKKSGQYWYALCAAVALAFIAKVGALLFLPVIGLCFILKNSDNLRVLFKRGMLGLLVVILLAGWLPVVRFAVESDSQNSMTFGSQSMHGGLRLDSTIKNLTTFNPIGILQEPFNSPWEDEQRRQYFGEYFYRSAFFGEFGFSDDVKKLAVSILLITFIFIPIIITGIVSDLIRKPNIYMPIALITFFMLLAQLAYRLYAPYSSNQDFRFSIALILPIAYYLLRGSNELPKTARTFVHACIVAACINTALFIGFLFFY